MLPGVSPRARSVALIAACGILLLPQPTRALADPASPTGLWRTIDDKTGHERALVRIWEQNGQIYGKIAQTSDPDAAKRTCDKCTDSRKGQPIIGLLIVVGLKRDGNLWDGGEILDPETGESYRCTMRLTDGGRKLVVRGYVGISLFGRSQVWQRVE